ncbi:MAG: hypothetical protein F2835_01030 [Actinobacteria bacterium]|nr:hypothetical protein [Actinomycetota bacterium]MSZ92923.1 hypothetical protein [Actinomycetota bacterium]
METAVFALFDSIFGLPGHPLLVHAAVVLVPLAAIGTVVIAFWPAARNRIGWITAVLGVIGFFFAFFAKESGEALLETVRVTAAVKSHAEMGDQGVIGAFLVGGSACTLMLFDQFVKERAKRNLPELSITRPLRTLIGVFAVVLCIFGSVLVVNVGHSGAKATWENKDVAPTVTYSGD